MAETTQQSSEDMVFIAGTPEENVRLGRVALAPLPQYRPHLVLRNGKPVAVEAHITE